MIPGLGGHLFSEFFLEHHIDGSPSAGLDHRALVAWRRQCRWLGPASSLRSLVDAGLAPLLASLGFAAPGHTDVHGDEAVCCVRGPHAPIVAVTTQWGQRLEPCWRTAVVHAGRHGAPWAVLFNGSHMRLICTERLYSRRYIEFDLDAVADDARTLAAFGALLHRRMFEADARLIGALLDRSERHAVGVCRSLREGVLDASGEILGAILPRRRHAADADGCGAAFNQALTLVYRILFLLFAEARGLLPLWHPVYRESYSMDALRGLAEQSESARGLWDGLRAASRMAHAGCRAGDLRVTAFNGRLFAPSRTPLVERRDLDDGAARRALVALSSRPAVDGTGREPIAYRDLGVEQLGAVYEALLDYEPRVVPEPPSSRGPRVRPRVRLERGSLARKATGSFYTPQLIPHYLVCQTLGPLVRDRSPDQILALKVLDPAMGSGAFLVAACQYLAQAYEAATVDAGGCHPTDFGPQERLDIRRRIAERCLYGVDMNPTAVELARLSIWLATLAADRPLGFLDHHLVTGNSLIGAWVASLRTPPGAARQRAPEARLPLFDEARVGDALRQALPVRFSLASTPDDTAEHVHQKERALAALSGRHAALSSWKRVADLWCSQWFSDRPAPDSAFADLSDYILEKRSALPSATARTHVEAAEAIAGQHRFFHWELEFPEAFFDEEGRRLAFPGFDAVLGNPPWDMVRADAGTSSERGLARREGTALRAFVRGAGVYEARYQGHANRYQLFVERMIALTKPGGRMGVIVPSGLAADRGSAPLRRLLFSRASVDAIVGFDNSKAIFPIHRSTRFLLATATAGQPTREILCRLGEHDPSILEEGAGDAGFTVRVTTALLERLSGDDVSLPDLRVPMDLAIAERAAALFAPLGDERGWSLRFGRELNATEDRGLFEAGGRGLPIVEGKQVGPFRADLASARWTIDARQAERMLGSRHQVPRLAYRDVAGPGNRLTLIAAILPAGCVTTHTVFCLRTPMALRRQLFLCGLFNSFVLNYLVRMRVTTHVTTAIVERLPVPREAHAPGAAAEIAACARILATRDDAGAAARLNARVAQLYQLTFDEFRHVVSTFPLVARDDREGALRAFQRLRS